MQIPGNLKATFAAFKFVKKTLVKFYCMNRVFNSLILSQR